jgi:hypothetical protein
MFTRIRGVVDDSRYVNVDFRGWKILIGIGRGRKKVGVEFNCFVPGFRPDRKRANFSIRTKRNIMVNSVDTGTNKDLKYYILSMGRRRCGGELVVVRKWRRGSEMKS